LAPLEILQASVVEKRAAARRAVAREKFARPLAADATAKEKASVLLSYSSRVCLPSESASVLLAAE
jgi:hypothetical protein